MDDTLELPVAGYEHSPPRPRTMDQIDKWIEEEYGLFFDRELYEREKRLNSVNLPFRLD